MAKRSDVMASTAGEKKMPKVVSHLEIRPNMKGGHDVHTVHTHSYDHPNEIKEFPGPHPAHPTQKGHVFAHLAGLMGIPTSGLAAGEEEPQSKKEGGEI